MKAHKNSWYKEWHQWRLSHHFHVLMLFVYLFVVISGSLLSFIPSSKNQAYASNSVNWDMETPSQYSYPGGITLAETGIAKLSSSYTPGTDWIATSEGYNWIHRKAVTITNPNATSDFQVKLSGVDTVLGGKMQANCTDLVFTSGDGATVIPHWVESATCPSASTDIWVKVPAGQTTVYMYYGSSKPEWTPRGSNRWWYGIASSSDGTKLAATVNGGQIYTSTDSGATWTPRDSNREWERIASSSDGTKLAATVYGGQIYTSTDSGVTWTPRESNRWWYGIASSSDGTKLAATVSGGQIYTSTDSGVTWTPRDSNRSWWGITLSSDGTKLAATVEGGQIYTSTDSGVTWTSRESSRSWQGIASSSDGTKLAAFVNNGQIYTSTDSGATWTPRDSNRNWTSIVSSSDGTKLAATVYGGQIYTSTDSGVTWTPRESNRWWYGIASSSDGTKLAAFVSGGQIYTSSTTNSDTNTFEKVISNVQGAWTMDETGNGSGITINDYSGNSNNGSTAGTTQSTGKVNNARGFNGISDIVSVPYGNSSLDITGSLTLSAWVNTSVDSTGGKTIFQKGYNNTTNYYFVVAGGGVKKLGFWWNNGGWRWYPSNTDISINTWHHVAVTVTTGSDGAVSGTFYLDGVADGTFTGPVAKPLLTNTNNLEIGRFSPSSLAFPGSIDEPRIYNTNLTQSQIQALAQEGSITGDKQSYFSPSAHSSTEYIIKYTANTSTSIGSETGLYPTDTPTIINTTSQKYNKISSFTETLGVGSTGSIKYQLSNDGGTTWYWYTGGSWTATASGYTESNTASQINTNISTFTGTYGSGTRDFKWKAFLISDGGQLPKLDNVNVTILDTIAPDNVSSVSSYSDGGKATSLTNDTWYNYNASGPYFEWTAPADTANDGVGGRPDYGEAISGIAGYYVYFGTDSGGTPTSFQAGTSYTAPALTSGSTYYLRIKTKDNDGNETSPQTLFTYKYDSNKPTNPPNLTRTPYPPTDVQDNFRFDWSGAADTGGSGVAKYQWKRAIDGSWTDTTNTFVTGVSAYQIGENWFYVRSVDTAGNIADNYTQIRYLWSGNAPPAPPNLEIVQNDSENNIQRFRWKAPTHSEAIQEYRYAVNVGDMNVNNTVSVSPTPDGEGWIYTPVGSYGTQQSTNTFRVVAVDALTQVNYTYYSEVEFSVSTPGPGFPTAPVISDISNMNTQKWALALSWDPPSPGGTPVASYVIQRTTTPENDNSWTDLAATSSTVYADNYQLNNSTDYSYRVKAVDNAGKRSTPSTQLMRKPTGKYSTKPTIVTGPTVTATATSAALTWSTERASTSFVKYGIDGGYGSSVGSNENVTTHTVNLSGLNPGTVYTYKVQSFDEQREYDINSESSWSGALTFSTQPAPGISDVKISDIRLDSSIVTWKTTSSATSTVKYGKTNSYGKEIVDSSGSSVTTHTVKLSGLDHSSTYHFKIFGTDTDGNTMQSDDYSFETLTFPKISNVRFQQMKNTATSTLKITWDSNVLVSSVVQYTDPTGKTQEVSQSQLVTSHELIVSGLKDNTEYTVTVRGRDAYGNEGLSETEKVKTDFDTRPPEISEITTETSISGYGSSAKSQLIVSWYTDEPSTSQVEYAKGVSGDTYTSATKEDSMLTTSHVVVVSDLDPSSSYYFRVVSKDTSKNEAKSDAQSALTEQARSSIFDIVLKSFESTLGWLFGGGR